MDHVCTAKREYRTVQVLVTTRRRTEARRKTRTRARDEPKDEDETPALERPHRLWEGTEEFDAPDIERVEDAEGNGSDAQVASPQDDLRAPLTIEEIAEEQRVEDFCQTVLARQTGSKDYAFFEDYQGVLKRRHPSDPDIVQVVVPRTLRAHLLRLCHNPAIAGHLWQSRMYHALRREYYWPHLAADVASTVRGCRTCAMNRVKLRKHLNRLRFSPRRVRWGVSR